MRCKFYQNAALNHAMEHFIGRIWTTGSALSVSYSVVSAVCAILTKALSDARSLENMKNAVYAKLFPLSHLISREALLNPVTTYYLWHAKCPLIQISFVCHWKNIFQNLRRNQGSWNRFEGANFKVPPGLWTCEERGAEAGRCLLKIPQRQSEQMKFMYFKETLTELLFILKINMFVGKNFYWKYERCQKVLADKCWICYQARNFNFGMQKYKNLKIGSKRSKIAWVSSLCRLHLQSLIIYLGYEVLSF